MQLLKSLIYIKRNPENTHFICGKYWYAKSDKDTPITRGGYSAETLRIDLERKNIRYRTNADNIHIQID